VPGSAHRQALATRGWVLTFTVALLFAGTFLRSLLQFEGGQLGLVCALLGVWATLVIVERPLSRRWKPWPAVDIVLQAVVVGVLLGRSDTSDYFAILLAVPCMQAMQRWRPTAALALIAAFAVLIVVRIDEARGLAVAISLAAVYTASSLFLASYALTARRATEARAQSDALAADLREANLRLAESARQAERLAGARERQRLARDLHDSVTQTLFSMTLAARSAALLLDRRPGALGAQLDEVERLATSAQDELMALGAELPSSPLDDGGLAASLRRHLDDRTARDGLQVSLEVEGARRFPPGVELALLRIVQEALNNVVKHAGVREAQVRLRLLRPATVEIEDRGRGFAAGAAGGTGAGLGIMTERAAEAGWRLTVTSRPGGTLVVAEEAPQGGDEGG
jgi:signal transduction histidine kinase